MRSQKHRQRDPDSKSRVGERRAPSLLRQIRSVPQAQVKSQSVSQSVSREASV